MSTEGSASNLQVKIKNLRLQWTSFDSLDGKVYNTLTEMENAIKRPGAGAIEELSEKHDNYKILHRKTPHGWNERVGIYCNIGKHYVVGPLSWYIPYGDKGEIAVKCRGCDGTLEKIKLSKKERSDTGDAYQA